MRGSPEQGEGGKAEKATGAAWAGAGPITESGVEAHEQPLERPAQRRAMALMGAAEGQIAEEVAQGQASEEVQHEGLQRQRPRPLARSGEEGPDGRCSR